MRNKFDFGETLKDLADQIIEICGNVSNATEYQLGKLWKVHIVSLMDIENSLILQAQD